MRKKLGFFKCKTGDLFGTMTCSDVNGIQNGGNVPLEADGGIIREESPLDEARSNFLRRGTLKLV